MPTTTPGTPRRPRRRGAAYRAFLDKLVNTLSAPSYYVIVDRLNEDPVLAGTVTYADVCGGIAYIRKHCKELHYNVPHCHRGPQQGEDKHRLHLQLLDENGVPFSIDDGELSERRIQVNQGAIATLKTGQSQVINLAQALEYHATYEGGDPVLQRLFNFLVPELRFTADRLGRAAAEVYAAA